jgi:hypothetical protein
VDPPPSPECRNLDQVRGRRDGSAPSPASTPAERGGSSGCWSSTASSPSAHFPSPSRSGRWWRRCDGIRAYDDADQVSERRPGSPGSPTWLRRSSPTSSSRSRVGWATPTRSRWAPPTGPHPASGASSAARRPSSACSPCRTCSPSWKGRECRRSGRSQCASPSSPSGSPTRRSRRSGSWWPHPGTPAVRGGHVTLEHDAMESVVARLWERGVIPDFRPPRGLRADLSPLSTGFAELALALAHVRQAMATVG